MNTDFHGKYRNLKHLNPCIKFREIPRDSVAKFFPIPYTKNHLATDEHGFPRKMPRNLILKFREIPCSSVAKTDSYGAGFTASG